MKDIPGTQRSRSSADPIARTAPQVGAADRSAGRTERATLELRRLILSLVLRPGETLTERRLERVLGVSRSPVRQALAHLAQEGLVRRQGRSFSVAPIDLAELDELFAFRELLETAAVRGAARDPSRADLAEVDAALLDLDSDASPEERLDVTARLHLGLARAGGNRFVAEALAALFPRVTRARFLELTSPSTIERADEEHRRIVALVKEGRGEDAARAVADHLRQTRDNLLSSLERQAGVRGILGEPLA